MEPQVAASVAPKREWARLSKAARARRKLESDELRRQAQALEAQRAALLPRGAEGHGSDEVRREAEAQRARRRVAEAANDALKAEARRLARNAERAGALLDKVRGWKLEAGARKLSIRGARAHAFDDLGARPGGGWGVGRPEGAAARVPRRDGRRRLRGARGAAAQPVRGAGRRVRGRWAGAGG